MLSCSGEVSRYARISRGAESTAERLGQLAELAIQAETAGFSLLHRFGPGEFNATLSVTENFPTVKS